MADGYAKTLQRARRDDRLERPTGGARDPRCDNCMAHCGYEPSAVVASLGLAAPVAARPSEHPLIDMAVIEVPTEADALRSRLTGAPSRDGREGARRARGRDPPVPRLERLGDRAGTWGPTSGSWSSPSPCTASSRPPTTPSSGTPVTRPTCTSSSRAGRATSPACASGAGCRATRTVPESEHDLVENSHASTALSYAYGLAKARQLRNDRRRVGRRRGRRRPDGRCRLRGAEQHRDLRRQCRRRPQRQRPLLCPDRLPYLFCGQLPGRGRLSGQGLLRVARFELRRARGRARPRGARGGAAACRETPGAGRAARAHDQGPRLRARRARRGEMPARRGPLRPGDRPQPPTGQPGA